MRLHSVLTAASLAFAFACNGDDTTDNNGTGGDADTDIDTDTDTDTDIDTDINTDTDTDTNDTDTNDTDMPARWVYAMTNEAVGNQVVQLVQDPTDDSLALVQSFATTGDGTGTLDLPALEFVDGIDPLVSQGSLARVGDYLLAVNAGSGSVTVFSVDASTGALAVTDVETVGAYPNSIASWEDHVYVGLSPGPDAQGGVAHLLLSETGDLTSGGDLLALSTPTSHPAQVLVTPGGSALVATELTTNKIAAWPLVAGEPGPVAFTTSNGPGPFGMVADDEVLTVTEAAPEQVGLASVSDYTVGINGALTVVSPSVPNGQSAACWIQETQDDAWLYVSNTDSGTVSIYSIGLANGIELVAGAAQSVTAPIDMALAPDDAFLYVLLGSTGQIAVFDVNATDGSLVALNTSSSLGLPSLGSQGIVAWQ